ncbi:hypothetical protein [Brunnivagina elsteri]|uniref:Uncharacterized protein n=1 Tax=Brunnivagina elsteri CCALA 953 TaxID=987040 RepID=A0A2A2TL95_9CYAN|nr:hypothetical protein [Calothrix elsteri]PAX56542.1 hypothetical protein CK510_10020 [Calothrix elsteri CCALA 953]
MASEEFECVSCQDSFQDTLDTVTGFMEKYGKAVNQTYQDEIDSKVHQSQNMGEIVGNFAAISYQISYLKTLQNTLITQRINDNELTQRALAEFEKNLNQVSNDLDELKQKIRELRLFLSKKA